MGVRLTGKHKAPAAAAALAALGLGSALAIGVVADSKVQELFDPRPGLGPARASVMQPAPLTLPSGSPTPASTGDGERSFEVVVDAPAVTATAFVRETTTFRSAVSNGPSSSGERERSPRDGDRGGRGADDDPSPSGSDDEPRGSEKPGRHGRGHAYGHTNKGAVVSARGSGGGSNGGRPARAGATSSGRKPSTPPGHTKQAGKGHGKAQGRGHKH